MVKPTTIHIILTITFSRSQPILQLDVQNAFIHDDIHETAYMHHPLSFYYPRHSYYVFLLQKYLQGLKQAPRTGYQYFADYVYTIEFQHNESYYFFFIYQCRSDMSYIFLYVDDIILINFFHDLCKYIMVLLASEFSMKVLRPLSYFQSIVVTRNTYRLFLSQSTYASGIISRVSMASCKPSATLVYTKQKLSTSVGTPYDNLTLYRSLDGVCIISHLPVLTSLMLYDR